MYIYCYYYLQHFFLFHCIHIVVYGTFVEIMWFSFTFIVEGMSICWDVTRSQNSICALLLCCVKMKSHDTYQRDSLEEDIRLCLQQLSI